jgi:hypothetical protein
MKTLIISFFLTICGTLAFGGEHSLRDVCSDLKREGTNKKLISAVKALNGPEFKTAAKRTENQEAYLKAIKEVISQTSVGPSLLKCLDDSSDSRFTPNVTLLVLPSDFLHGLTASFQIRDDDFATTKKYDRWVSISSEENPMAAISFIAHEMKHSCAASALETSYESASKEKQDQFVFVDELKAYQLQEEFFLELAEQVPSLVCESKPVPSSLFEHRSFTLQDLMAEVHDSIENGTFYKSLIKSYTSVHVFNSESSFYNSEDTESSSGAKTLKPEVVSAMSKEGFDYSP